MYANWDRMKPEVREAYLASAAEFLDTIKEAADGWAK